MPPGQQLRLDSLRWTDDRIVHLTAHFGFRDPVDVPAIVRRAAAHGLDFDVTNPSYFVSRVSLRRTGAPGMRPWRKGLFLGIAKLAADPVDFFKLPDDRVIVVGSRVGL